MPTFVFGSQELQGLGLRGPPTALWIVFQDEIHEGLADEHAHLGRLAGVGTGVAATAFINSHIRRPLKHQILSHGIKDDCSRSRRGISRLMVMMASACSCVSTLP